MASLAVMNAIGSIVSTNWSHTPIFDPNTIGSVPTDNSAFIEIGYPYMTARQYSFGATTNYHEETGGVRIGLFIPIGIGINPSGAPWMTRIENLMQQFRGKFTSGIEFLGFVGPNIRDDSDEGAYYEISFVISYRRLSLA